MNMIYIDSCFSLNLKKHMPMHSRLLNLSKYQTMNLKDVDKIFLQPNET